MIPWIVVLAMLPAVLGVYAFLSAVSRELERSVRHGPAALPDPAPEATGRPEERRASAA